MLLLVALFSCRDGTAPPGLPQEVVREVIDGGCDVFYDPGCADLLREPTGPEEQQLQFYADNMMLHWDPDCYSIGLDLSNRISSGLVKVWDGPSFGVNGDWHGDHPNNPWRGQVHMWTGSTTWQSTFIHEGAHSILGASDGPASQPGTAAYYGQYCWSTLALSHTVSATYALVRPSGASILGG